MAVVNTANGLGFLQYLTIQVNGKCEKHENWLKDGIPAKCYPVITLVVTIRKQFGENYGHFGL